ncbi:hypothetical protein WDW37_14405 [Bdellovibrionota bacterium FG-1]
MASKHLNRGQMRGLEKLGDSLLPGDQQFQTFSGSGCAQEVDRILDYMPEGDLKDLKLLFSLMSWFPPFAVRGFIALLEKSLGWPDWIGAPLRFIRLGLRGLIMTLYYSHPQAHAVLEYKVGVYTEDMPSPR